MQIRTDSWASALTEQQQWQLYYRSRQMPWNVAADWAAKEFHLPAPPPRTSFYRFLSAMRKEESNHRLDQAAIARAEAQDLAKAGKLDEVTSKSLIALGVETALSTGDGKAAANLIRSAMAIQDRIHAAKELELKEKAQATKDSALALAREKFEAAERRENAAKGAIADVKLSDAERMAKLREIYGI